MKDPYSWTRCDRCGRTNFSGHNDLVVLWEGVPSEIQGEGNFCLRCVNRFTIVQWLVWCDVRRESHVRQR